MKKVLTLHLVAAGSATAAPGVRRTADRRKTETSTHTAPRPLLERPFAHSLPRNPKTNPVLPADTTALDELVPRCLDICPSRP